MSTLLFLGITWSYISLILALRATSVDSLIHLNKLIVEHLSILLRLRSHAWLESQSLTDRSKSLRIKRVQLLSLCCLLWGQNLLALMNALHATLLLVLNVLSALAKALGRSWLGLCHLYLAWMTDSNLCLNRVAMVLEVHLCLALLLLTWLGFCITRLLALLFVLVIKCLLDQKLLAIVKLQLIVVCVCSLVLRWLTLCLNQVVERFLSLSSSLIEIV